MKIDLLVAGNLAEDVVFGKSHYGGSAGLIALNANTFGLSTGVISNYGQDSFSRQYVDYLESRGVSTELLQPGLQSIAQCVVSSSENHSSSKQWIDNGTSHALEELVPSEEQCKIIAEARFLHLTTTPRSLALILSGIYRPSGILGYEPGPRVGDEDGYFDEIVFQKSDMLFVNEEELRILEGRIGAATLKRMMHEDQMIIATKGKDGTEVITKTGRQLYPVDSVPQSRVLDSNGAGDAFKSGFYVGLAKTGRIDVAIEYGNTLGAHIVQKEGALLEPTDIEMLEVAAIQK